MAWNQSTRMVENRPPTVIGRWDLDWSNLPLISLFLTHQVLLARVENSREKAPSFIIWMNVILLPFSFPYSSTDDGGGVNSHIATAAGRMVKRDSGMINRLPDIKRCGSPASSIVAVGAAVLTKGRPKGEQGKGAAAGVACIWIIYIVPDDTSWLGEVFSTLRFELDLIWVGWGCLSPWAICYCYRFTFVDSKWQFLPEGSVMPFDLITHLPTFPRKLHFSLMNLENSRPPWVSSFVNLHESVTIYCCRSSQLLHAKHSITGRTFTTFTPASVRCEWHRCARQWGKMRRLPFGRLLRLHYGPLVHRFSHSRCCLLGLSKTGHGLLISNFLS